MTDREWLLELADKLDSGTDFFEEPEGTLWLEMTNERAVDAPARLRAIAGKLASAEVGND